MHPTCHSTADGGELLRCRRRLHRRRQSLRMRGGLSTGATGTLSLPCAAKPRHMRICPGQIIVPAIMAVEVAMVEVMAGGRPEEGRMTLWARAKGPVEAGAAVSVGQAQAAVTSVVEVVVVVAAAAAVAAALAGTAATICPGCIVTVTLTARMVGGCTMEAGELRWSRLAVAEGWAVIFDLAAAVAATSGVVQAVAHKTSPVNFL
jgi:hypothetical protein